MKVIGIIQARMTSTRLPGKVMKTVNGTTLLEYQLERVKRSKRLDQIIVATTNNGTEQPIVDLCRDLNITIYQGSEEDVLERYYQTAKKHHADIIVRMTSDCPLIDPKVIDKIIKFYLDNNYDYVSNTQIRSFPRGMDTEVFSMDNLEAAYLKASEDYEKEHVTPYFYLNPNLYSIGQFVSKPDTSKYRLTVDTEEDFELISTLIKELYPVNPLFTLNDIIEEMQNQPHLIDINKHIVQKELRDNL
ncbi:cytidylyltransferase domain-containing protein [Oceanobacillus chungangensis]|uniref:Acylneuraminate cytidylyltransferase n=1 Tax=Oceanobacillus chungangensis TaxID=1229152 RepID=A0A3D8Q194_9BACI|nr:glycosyltransferase family protein [Oceanobacillus chungangensis]RDW20775.1 acylneuraminate cytidylyltransferase [Oceanobacillus chungangensis]